MMKLKIKGMSCQHCVMRVQKALEKVPGVVSVKVNLTKGEAEINTQDTVSSQELIAAVEKAGYEAQLP
ncbi:MAG: cation transporter [Candidatus Atribacteria bacterium]|nr:cation transporter [Candidatus Atribacteria bacterium]